MGRDFPTAATFFKVPSCDCHLLLLLYYSNWFTAILSRFFIIQQTYRFEILQIEIKTFKYLNIKQINIFKKFIKTNFKFE